MLKENAGGQAYGNLCGAPALPEVILEVVIAAPRASGLIQLRRIEQADAVADACYAFLRETKKALATLPEDIPDGSAELFSQQIKDYEAETQRKRDAGLLGKAELTNRLQVQAALHSSRLTRLSRSSKGACSSRANTAGFACPARISSTP